MLCDEKEEATLGSPKQNRLSPEVENPATPFRHYGSPYFSPYVSPYPSALRPQSQSQDPTPPEKQHPAPLSRDPNICPEAATIASSQSRKRLQPGMAMRRHHLGRRLGSEREDITEETSLLRVESEKKVGNDADVYVALVPFLMNRPGMYTRCK